VKHFKFFNGKKTLDWQRTGLLEGATNVELLVNALDLTYDYIMENILRVRVDNCAEYMLPIMVRLFRNKNNFYSNEEIINKVNEVFNLMGDPSITRLIQEIMDNAWYGVYVEAEMCAIIAERTNWIEND
jgi:hypothetical protein